MRFHKLEEFLRSEPGRVMCQALGGGDIADIVRNSQKFYVGTVDLLADIKPPDLYPRLPFQLCAFEFELPPPSWATRQCAHPYFVIAHENPQKTVTEINLYAPATDGLAPIEGWMHVGAGSINRDTPSQVVAIPNKRTVDFTRLAETESTYEEIEKAAAIFVESFSQLLGLFLSVLNCSNIAVAETAPPVKLNKARAKAGKVPIYSYRTLVIANRVKRQDGGGTHDSPRIHLRRGHIKRRKTGNFWWQPCVVGRATRGIVMKDYRADALLASVNGAS